MANESKEGGFGWGLMLGGVIGFLAGAYLASGPGREQVDSLKTRTIELTGRKEEVRARAREAAARAADMLRDSQGPFGRAVQEGVAAARRRRGELEVELEPKAPGPEPGA